ncbi:hypothetical protein KUTeg_017680, partial [Tegillarca granosa]
MSEYEAVLKKLGSFGPFQRRVFILVSMFETPAAWAMLLPILLSASPDYTCSGPINVTNGNYDEGVTASLNVSSTLNLNNSTLLNTCFKNNHVCPGIKFIGGFTSIISEWNLVCENKKIAGYITTIQMCGVLLGALITGQLADIFGRRKVLYLEYIMLLIVSFASAFAGSWQLFAAFRFVIGGLVGGVLVVNFVLPLEYVTPSWRTFCGAVGFWAVGLMTLAYLGFLFLLHGESPRWLLSKGRYKEAVEIINRMAEYNNKQIGDLSGLQAFAEQEQKLRNEKKLYSYWDLFRSKTMAKNSLIVMFVSSSVYYGLNFNTRNLAGDRYLNIFIAGLVEIPALVFVLLVNNRLGRRKTVSVLMLVAGISCFSVLFIDIAGKLESLSVLTVVLAMVGKSGISGGWAAVQVFSAETFPTTVRNLGIGACSMSARIGGIVAPLLVQLGTDAKPLPFTVFGVLAIICGILTFFLPETAGQPLQDDLVAIKRNNPTDGNLTENGHYPGEITILVR